jgi:hypothetical protein
MGRIRHEPLEARGEYLALAGDQAVDEIEAGHVRRRAEEDVEASDGAQPMR